MAAPEGGSLPLEVLVDIYSWQERRDNELSGAHVSRLMRDVSRRPILRQRLTLTREISLNAAVAMLRRSPQLAVLSIIYCDYTNQVLRAASTHNPELRVVEVTGAVSDTDLEAVALCTQLRTLTLQNTSGVTDSGVLHLARLRHMEELIISGENRVTPAGWRRLFSTCKWRNLRELGLWLSNEDGVHFERLPTSLRSVAFCGPLSDGDLAAVGQCRELRTLLLPNMYGVTDDSVMHLARLSHLEQLQLMHPNSVTRAGWRRLFSVCKWPHLRQLSLEVLCSGRKAPQVTFERLPTSLRSLKLYGSVSHTDLAVVAQCDQLRALSLCLSIWNGVTDAGLVLLVRLQRLEKLVVVGGHRVTADGWRRLFSTCRWPDLRELSLWMCYHDVPLVQFGRFPTLRSIELYGCVCDGDLEALVQCAHLRTLSLNHSYELTNGGVHLARLKRLETLEMCGADSVTPAGWRRMFSMCKWPHLRELTLELYDKDGVSRAYFERLPTSLRSIKLDGGVSDGDLEAVSQCAQLRTLTLCLSILNGVTDDGVVLLARLRHLEKLLFMGANKVKPAGWRRLFSMCKWPHLRELSLHLSYAAGDLPKGTFERLPASLRSLKLRGCVCDADLVVVAQCDQLRALSLYLSNSSAVTDDGVVLLARLRHLEKLHIGGRNSVTAAGSRRLLSICDWPYLRELSLQLSGVGEDDKDGISRQAKLLCPKVTIY